MQEPGFVEASIVARSTHGGLIRVIGGRGRNCLVILGAALIAATTTVCRPKPASVEELYTARMLGLSYLQRNQLPEAESEFRKLTRLAPDDPLGYTNLGLTYLQAIRPLR